MLRLLPILISLSISALLAPLPASAEDSVTITVGADSVLLDPTLVEVPVSITCAPMDVYYNMGSAELRQAVSKQLIAYGRGYEQSPIVCDGQPHANSYLLWADPSGAPFTKGDATVFVGVYLCSPSYYCQSGNSGYQITHIKR